MRIADILNNLKNDTKVGDELLSMSLFYYNFYFTFGNNTDEWGHWEDSLGYTSPSISVGNIMFSYCITSFVRMHM